MLHLLLIDVECEYRQLLIMPRTRSNNSQVNDRSVLLDQDHSQIDNDVSLNASSSHYQSYNSTKSLSSSFDVYVSAVQSMSSAPDSPQVTVESTGSSRRKNKLPHDKKRRVQWAFMLMGITTLLPWNFLITPMNYWNYKFRNITANDTDGPDDPSGHVHSKTELQTYFASCLSIASNVPFVFMLILLTTIDQRISQDFRTILGLIGISVLFIFTTILVDVNTDAFQVAFFKLTLATVVVLSCFSAVLQGAFVSTAACFPSRNILAYTTGQSLAGLLAVIAQLIIMSGPVTPTQSGLYFFLTADLILIITLIVYLTLPRFEYFSFWSKKVLSSESPSIPDSGESSQSSSNEASSSSAQSGSSSSSVSIAQAFTATKWHAITIFNVYAMTMAVFPPLTVLVNPVHPNRSPWSGRFFTPVTNFLIFSLADFMGRAVSKRIPLPLDWPIFMASLSFARWLLVPLLMLCNAHPRKYLPVVFENDTIFIFLVLFTGLSHGYLFINAVVNGPEYVAPWIRPKVGYVSVLMLGLAVATGSLASYLVLLLL